MYHFNIIYHVGARISTLMSISDGSGPLYFPSKDGKVAAHERVMDGKVFISRQSWHFLFVNIMIKVLFPILYCECRIKKHVSHQGRSVVKK